MSGRHMAFLVCVSGAALLSVVGVSCRGEPKPGVQSIVDNTMGGDDISAPVPNTEQVMPVLHRGASTTIDARGPLDPNDCHGVTLVARKTYQPTRWVDGVVTLAEEHPFAIPAHAEVLNGNAEQKWLRFQFQDSSGRIVTCDYQGDGGPAGLGTGSRYLFRRCNNSAVAGDIATASALSLHIVEGDKEDGTGETIVSLGILPETPCVCQPWTCSDIGGHCGVHPNGCGGVMDCGACTAPQSSCFGIELVASQAGDPPIWHDATHTLSNSMQYSLPGRVPLTQGVIGPSAYAILSVRNGVEPPLQCEYGLNALDPVAFDFVGCNMDAAPGQILSASSFGLAVNNTGSATTVSLFLPAQPCNCAPITCDSLGATCGVRTDGCSGLISCGSCAAPETCGTDPAAPLACGCTPRTCLEQGAQCGAVDDGCGGSILCGECGTPETCGGSGVPNHCGCTPRTCTDAGASCGLIADGCGSYADCGGCELPNSCDGKGDALACACEPARCADFGRACGVLTDGCSQLLQCGECPDAYVCDTREGRCIAPEIFSSSDSVISGAKLQVPAESTGSFSVSSDPLLQPNYEPGSLVSSPRGPGIAIGPVVSFTADGHSAYRFEPCALKTYPYDPKWLEENPPATVDDILIFVVEPTASGYSLVQEPTPYTVDPIAHTVTTCSTHLSSGFTFLRIFCPTAPTVRSAPIEIIDNPQTPPDLSTMELSTAKAKTYSETDFGPPGKLAVTAEGSNPNACVSLVLLYGAGTLDHACFYSNAHYDLDSTSCGHWRVTACNSVAGDYERVACYKLSNATTDSPSPPPFPSALLVGKLDSRWIWIDQSLPTDPKNGKIRASTYLLSALFTQRAPEVNAPLRSAFVSDVTNIVGSFAVQSHPIECRGIDGFNCGDANDGCDGLIRCNAACTQTKCSGPGSCDAPYCCGEDDEHCTLTPKGICGCPDGQPDCNPSACPLCPDGQSCGSGQVLSSGLRDGVKNVCWCPPGSASTCVGGALICPDGIVDTSNFCVTGITCDDRRGVWKDPGTPCSDHDACNGLERCYAINVTGVPVCVSNPAPIIDDGNPCTDDRCDPMTGPYHCPGSPLCKDTKSSCDVQGGCFVPSVTTTLTVDISAKFDQVANDRIATLKSKCQDCQGLR